MYIPLISHIIIPWSFNQIYPITSPWPPAGSFGKATVRSCGGIGGESWPCAWTPRGDAKKRGD